MPAPKQGEDNSILLSSHPNWTKFILLLASVNPVVSNPSLEMSCNSSYTISLSDHVRLWNLRRCIPHFYRFSFPFYLALIAPFPPFSVSSFLFSFNCTSLSCLSSLWLSLSPPVLRRAVLALDSAHLSLCSIVLPNKSTSHSATFPQGKSHDLPRSALRYRILKHHQWSLHSHCYPHPRPLCWICEHACMHWVLL